ncbi:MAG: TIGR04442 family protein [Deltaproteobacteria bacterium]|nr:TIGR04442 family protein [Deltaproteobacteria bacterium]
MIQEIRFHGKIGDDIEYYATVLGTGLMHQHFYESRDGKLDRFFYGGKEFVIDEDGITHKGNGGSFCKYMFGVEQPLKDLIRKDVENRLAMYGAKSDKESGLTFTNSSDGHLDFNRIFIEGNAVSNYYFFMDFNFKGEVKDQQEQILKLTGKTLKYTRAIARGDDSALTSELGADLDGYKPVIFLFRIENRYHKRYYDLFKELYGEKKELTPEGQLLLQSLADEFNINHYQQERIKLDVTYNHAENKRVVDEYKDVLISFEAQQELGSTDTASLNRLRALAIKNNIPHYLFDLLDEVLLKDKKLVHGDEPDYIKQCRAILDGLFSLEDGSLETVIDKADIVKLLADKKRSMEKRDYFDGLLLEVGKSCDENFQRGDTNSLERFSELITFFDRFDTTSSMINHLAFMAEDVTVETLRSILGNKRAFEDIEEGLFDTLFIKDLVINKYLTYAGKKKINTLSKGLIDVEEGYKALNIVAEEIALANEEDRIYNILYNTAKERLRDIPGAMSGKDDDDSFLKEVLKSLLKDSPVEKIPKKIMKKVFTSLKMEGFYSNEVLPKIIETEDMPMREDFLHNSGFDRFFIEDIERLYLEKTEIPAEKVKKFKELVDRAGLTQDNENEETER